MYRSAVTLLLPFSLIVHCNCKYLKICDGLCGDFTAGRSMNIFQGCCTTVSQSKDGLVS